MTLLRVTLTLAIMVGALAALAIAWSAPAAAETFTVTNSGDSGDNSLRWAIEKANETDAADTILFGPVVGSTITLSATLTVTKPLTIEGPPWMGIKISGNDAVRPFYVDRTTLNISGLTIADGRVSTLGDTQANYGGAVYNKAGTLTIRDSVLTYSGYYSAYRGGAISNFAGNVSLINSSIRGYNAFIGGAIYNETFSTLTLRGTTLSGNFALGDGGAIYNNNSRVSVTAGSRLEGNAVSGSGGGIYNESGSRATITDSTVSGNRSSEGVGGGVYTTGLDLAVQHSTFSGNRSAVGGGLYAASGSSTIINSTFAGNVSVEEGGGIAIGGGSATITNSTVSGNVAGSGAAGGGISAEGTATIRGSVVAGNTASSGNTDVVGNFTDGGFNIVGGTAGAAGLQTDVQGKPVLAANGGPTKTVALVRGGDAIDAGNSFGSATDQRGTPRPKDYAAVDNAAGGDGSDIGAFEYVDPDASAPTVRAAATPPPNPGGPNNSDVTVSISASDEEGGSGVWRVSYSASGAQQVPEQDVAGDAAELVVSADGETVVTYWATDKAGNRSESRTITVRVDSAAPKVARATPTGGKVLPRADVAATFSEAMDGASVRGTGAFTLKRNGATKAVPATVTYDEEAMKATLDPAGKLISGATYVARVSTDATDPAGNALDQDATTAGNQQKTWRFKVR